ncbi:hypothetical protein MON38_22535 [Hymenobacter sp. DH14]|uniref:Uncharacterized protein n=1 Tax=Hymenobacter cyanobacteriorum TaxID=2926463 RepID=A0A9X1VJ71_9BACT|nr:hypothetical protein [Hymenobacter cyanobacteriorum]MCI1190214.1 hypothetical protein [Hymenobacter cyanobacteriorum]
MNFKVLTQVLSNNQKETIAGVFALAAAIIAAVIAGVFLLLSVAMTKETPAPVVKHYNYAPTYITLNVVAATPAPQIAPARKAPQPHKLPRKQHRKPVAKPQPQPSCPCADSTKKSA